MPIHVFGEHAVCDVNWCGYLKDPGSYRYRGLPCGRDLSNVELKKESISILSAYAKNADTLANRDSSQQNESLHNTIGNKCPKIRDYSSGSGTFRTAPAFAQKMQVMDMWETSWKL